MGLEIILTPPPDPANDYPNWVTIYLKVEKLTYGIHRNIIVTQFANKDETKIGDVQTSLLNISINGILTSVSDIQDLITAARSWWVTGSTSTSDVTTLGTIQWRNRSQQRMVIERLEITDTAETDSHEFEFSLELKLDTRTS